MASTGIAKCLSCDWRVKGSLKQLRREMNEHMNRTCHPRTASLIDGVETWMRDNEGFRYENTVQEQAVSQARQEPYRITGRRR